MAENKTKPTDASVEDYIASRANAQQRTDCRELMALFKKITRHSPRMWGPSIVGYGSYRYTYESGRTGEAPLAAFAIRGRELVVYLVAEGAKQGSLLSKLGKHKMGKSACTSSSLLILMIGARKGRRRFDRGGQAALGGLELSNSALLVTHVLTKCSPHSARRSSAGRSRRGPATGNRSARFS